MSADNPAEEQQSTPREARKKPVTNAQSATPIPNTGPDETLMERVTGFMDTYGEN